MGVKFKLTIVSFLEFFVWGAWLITLGNYWLGTKQWGIEEFGAIFSTMGIASLFVPTLTGIIADRWLNAEKLFGILHILYACTLFYLPTVEDPQTFFWVMLLAMCFYMPTIALNNAIAYTILKNNQFDVVKAYPPIRVFGTIGFVIAMWLTNLTGNKDTVYQFYFGGIAAIVLGIMAFSLPPCPPQKNIATNAHWTEQLGLNAFKLFKDYKMALFFIFSMLLGAALQLTNAYGDRFVDEFKYFPKFAESVVVKRSTMILSISQISETIFILAIPFFLQKMGIKKVMLMSMFAWVLRFALLGMSDPGEGLWMLLLSCVVYGMAFDFFNISGSLFVESSTTPQMRAAGQGLFMMMSNGLGAIMGSYASGKLISKYFTLYFDNEQHLATYLQTEVGNTHLRQFVAARGIQIDANGLFNTNISMIDWSNVWFSFAAYALIIAVLFAVLFRHKHQAVSL